MVNNWNLRIIMKYVNVIYHQWLHVPKQNIQNNYINHSFINNAEPSEMGKLGSIQFFFHIQTSCMFIKKRHFMIV